MTFQKGYIPWNKSVQLVEQVKCACGCSQLMNKYDSRNRVRKYAYGHGSTGRKFPGLKHDKQFKKGQSPWNKGIHIENQGTFKIGHKINAGRKFPPEFGEKLSKAMRGRKPNYYGETHWNWKGGVTKEDKYLRQKFRKTIGKDVLKRDNYTCQDCKTKGVYLHVDHIKEWAKYPTLRFEVNNCITLCYKCHYKKTFGREIPDGLSWGKL